jgi:hypothetical protein
MIPDTIYIIIKYNNDMKLRELSKDWKNKHDGEYDNRNIISNVNNNITKLNKIMSTNFKNIKTIMKLNPHHITPILDEMLNTSHKHETKIENTDIYNEHKYIIPLVKHYDVTKFLKSLKIKNYTYKYNKVKNKTGLLDKLEELEQVTVGDFDYSYEYSYTNYNESFSAVCGGYGFDGCTDYTGITSDVTFDVIDVQLTGTYVQNIKYLIKCIIIAEIVKSMWLWDHVNFVILGEIYSLYDYEEIFNVLNNEYDIEI